MSRLITNEDIACGLPWCIAGGFAACPGLAEDQDVWVFGDRDDRDFILMKLRRAEQQYGLDLFEEESLTASLKENEARYNTEMDGLCHTWKVAKLVDGRHVLLTNAYDVSNLLDSFDISTHQCALSPDGEFIKGTLWTPITEPPLRLRHTPTTDARLEKITKRYERFQMPTLTLSFDKALLEDEQLRQQILQFCQVPKR
jgi:hypothetical protein